MKSDDLKSLNEHFMDEVFRHHNVNAVDEMLTDDFVEHIPPPGYDTSREGAKQYLGEVLRAFPDVDYQFEEQIVEGDTLASLVRMTGTHSADFMGVPATGRKVSIEFMDLIKVRDDRFSEHWGLTDMSGLMSQLGVNPPTATMG